MPGSGRMTSCTAAPGTASDGRSSSTTHQPVGGASAISVVSEARSGSPATSGRAANPVADVWGQRPGRDLFPTNRIVDWFADGDVSDEVRVEDGRVRPDLEPQCDDDENPNGRPAEVGRPRYPKHLATYLLARADGRGSISGQWAQVSGFRGGGFGGSPKVPGLDLPAGSASGDRGGWQACALRAPL